MVQPDSTRVIRSAMQSFARGEESTDIAALMTLRTHHAIANQFQGWTLGWVRRRLAMCLPRAVVHRPAQQLNAIVLQLAEHIVDHFVDQQYPRRVQAALPQRWELPFLLQRSR